MYVLTNEQMQQVDAETIDRICPGLELMERAGRGCAQVIHERHGGGGEAGGAGASGEGNDDAPRAVIFVGPGNNGGDGLVIARHLAQLGWACAVHLLKPADAFTPDASKNYQRLKKVVSRHALVREIDASRADWGERAQEELAGADVVVDAILGTGVSGAPRGAVLEAIRLINGCAVPVVAIDIPSGVNGSTGESPGEAVGADETLTIGAPKVGLLFHPGRHLCGEVSVIDIGFPDEIIEKHAEPHHLLDRAEAARRLPYRAPATHKFDAGVLVLVAGSAQYRGAALLAGEAALRGGCGMVYLGLPASIRTEIDVALREVITVPLPETGEGTVAPEAVEHLQPYLGRAHAVAIGPGIGRHPETERFVREFLGACGLPAAVDADAVTAFAGQPEQLGELDPPAVITPHSGELGRLLGEEIAEGAVERLQGTAAIAQQLRVTLLHKGAPTLVAEPLRGVYVNTTGSSALASGGTGDVLTGLLGSFLAQGASPIDAACLAAWLHGRAGDLAAAEWGRRGVIAGDLLRYLGGAMVELEAAGA
jgi:NAD(P)H-hydrate epimerase